MFKESEFIFDGIPSSEFDLRILGIGNNSGTEDVQSVPNKEFTIITSPRIAKNRIIGVAVDEPLSFEVEFISCKEDYICREKINEIHNWLFNKSNYKKLQIIQDDMQLYYFNCFFTDVKDICYGNEIIGISATIQCDSNCAYENDTILTYTDLESNVMKNIPINVRGCGVYGLKPIIEFTLAGTNTDFAIINTTTQINPVPFMEKSVTFGFIGLQVGDTITVDCEKQIITALSGNKIYGCFTGEFMTFTRGLNNLIVWGELTNLKITYRNEKKVGV